MSFRDSIATPLFILFLLPILVGITYALGIVNKTIVGISIIPLAGYILINRQQLGLTPARKIIPHNIAQNKAREQLKKQGIEVTTSLNHTTVYLGNVPHYVFFFKSPCVGVDKELRVLVDKYDGNIPEKHAIDEVDVLEDIRTRQLEIQKTYTSTTRGEVAEIKRRLEQLELAKDLRTSHPKRRINEPAGSQEVRR